MVITWKCICGRATTDHQDSDRLLQELVAYPTFVWFVCLFRLYRSLCNREQQILGNHKMSRD
ncbi:hypothetical protein FQN60_002832 [Etheostoma spectabile]|uniref:Uncharacterized protein n=1 Tax=Etheostoma spectabile TaxID=54343 RepID=A0A5J5CMQ2_9PERO|nr:hypothetical protein FQN60_002832 [Etheostoma spectabile]